MMVSDHKDPIALEPLLEQDMVWEFLEITPSLSAGIVMVPFWVALNVIDRLIHLLPELITQFIRGLRILCRNVSRVLCRSRVNDQWLHRAILPSAKLPELFLGDASHLAGVQFRRPVLNLLIIHPVVGSLKAAEEQNRQFSPFWF
jgi:hypothetical protein